MRISLISDQTRDSAVSVSTKELLRVLCIQYPIFNLPIVNGLATAAIGSLMKMIINETQLGLVYIAAFGSSNRLVSDFKISWEQHYELEKTGTPEEIAASEADLVNKARAMLNISKPL